MKLRLILFALLSAITTNAFAYRDSADYDSGDGGFVFALIIIGLLIIAPIIGFFRNLFK